MVKKAIVGYVINKPYKKKKLKNELPLHLMLAPGIIIIFIFSYIPMAGMIIAFQKFIPAKGLFGDQKWVGLDNFKYLFNMPGAISALKNTVSIAFFKIIFGLLIPITVAVLLNEVRSDKFKRIVQTAIYLPHFLSWVVLGGVMIDILSPSSGAVNKFLELFGIRPIFFLGSNNWFQQTVIATDIWKGFGFGTIVYLAAITGIDLNLYEAATMDGANRFHKIWHITLPGIHMIVILMCVLSLGNVLNAGFEQILNLYSPQVYEKGDILDTFIYRIGLIDAQFSPATAMGIFKSLVSAIFISVSYYTAYKFFDYRVF
jgi:putative aldouronate transport system permease protein